jgi:FHA domain
MRCPFCAHENPSTAQVCENCGAGLLFGVRPLYPLIKRLEIYIQGDESETPIPVTLDKALVIGRVDETNLQSAPPDIDLTRFAALKKGVSRRHAQLARKEGKIILEDMGSTNSTYLNEKRLVPHSEYIVRDGDAIRLGHLVLHVRFKYESW